MLFRSKDILDSLGSDEAPEHFLLTLGYCAWGQGQLEGEIADNDWLTVSAAKAGADVLWHTPPAGRWAAAMKLLGVQAWQISAKAGRA